ncbi:MAG: hypothetical protein NTY50_10060 [Methylobacter sp.]|nr:hypothetical protein [Methylobacter sp.]
MINKEIEVSKSQAILQAWMPFKQVIGVTSVYTEEDYARAILTIDMLLNEIGDDEGHPLADVLNYLADQVKVYEDEHISILNAEPRDVLCFLMEQHGLRQEDLNDCAPQSRISEILAGKRAISKKIAKCFANRFNIPIDLFL